MSKIAAIRTLIALAVIHDLIVHQMDVKIAFLNVNLEEKIYMSQPEGFVVQGQENKVCKLKKSLYGLRQAPKQCVQITLDVDHMLILGNTLDVVNKTKELLSSNFDMKGLGEAGVILGVRIIRNFDGISLSQSYYVEMVLKKFNSFDVAPARTLYDLSLHLNNNMGENVSLSEYIKIIDSVMILMNCTRPDIAYAVSRLSHYTHNLSGSH
ncbi:hypothetical protein LIER_35636 [Lithospermum erythrorhizon]|uniref:Reverse transcriptase Ty1/copia-type domain-containing protein n=1 Tax=Lithospermum erythrorhizon TaxID=34254 RepID=A0AAV3NTS3_LITER